MLYSITKFFAAIIAPPFCFYCRIWLLNEATFCADCYEKISHPSPFFLKHDWGVVPVYAVSAYQDPVKKLILAKYYRDRIAAYQLGLLMTQALPTDYLFDYIIPIPLHWMRYAWRGYNQATEIAQSISVSTNTPILHALKRVRRTKNQSTLTKLQRAENVHHVFLVKPWARKLLHGKKILLIDDLMTTGSTLSVALRTMHSANPAEIRCLVACRVV